MRTKWKLWLSMPVVGGVLLIVGCSWSGASAKQAATGGSVPGVAKVLAGEGAVEMTVDPAVALFRPPSVAPVYEIVPKAPATREAMEFFADNVGLGGVRRYGNNGLSDSEWSLVFPQADDIGCYSLTSQAYADGRFDALAFQGKSVGLPSFSECRTIADAFLKRLGETGAVCRSVTVKSTLTRTGGGQPDLTIPTSISVDYRPEFMGEKLQGAGGKFEVVVGGGGAVLGVEKFVEDVKPHGEGLLRSVNDALASLALGEGERPPSSIADRFSRVTVTSVHLAYYAETPMVRDSLYRPVYVFAVEGIDGTEGEWVVAALADGVLSTARQ